MEGSVDGDARRHVIFFCIHTCVTNLSLHRLRAECSVSAEFAKGATVSSFCDMGAFYCRGGMWGKFT